MSDDSRPSSTPDGISRRDFMKVGSVALAGGSVLGATTEPVNAGDSVRLFPTVPRQDARIRGYRTLGRTGWRVSDIGMGSVPLRESAVVRYAFDKGINYFDTAGSYGNGAAERAIGEALQHMDRSKVFITSKSRISENDTTATIVQRVRETLQRLRTEYVDAYSMHGPSTVESLDSAAYHAAMTELKAEGRVKFTGLSYHGPGGPSDQSMADVLTAAAEDGRFDVMLFVYNFLNRDEADRIIAACKANNVGTTAMKTQPGVLGYEPLDPNNLTEQQEQYVERFTRRGSTREAALERLEAQTQRQQELYDRTRPFVERYGISSEEQLRLGSIHWVLQNPDMHTACVSFTNFEFVDKVVPLSGTELTPAEEDLLEELALALGNQYCRHGCSDCAAHCPNGVSVSTIMRYAYYYEGQGLEKYAMGLYGGLGRSSASACVGCIGHCDGACPHGIDILPNMLKVHDLLTLA